MSGILLLKRSKRVSRAPSRSKSPIRKRGITMPWRQARTSCRPWSGFLTKSAFTWNACSARIIPSTLELVYFFNTHLTPCRVKVTLKIDPQQPVAPSVSAIYPCANWYEREIHEFYGVLFTGHPNMTYLFLHNDIDDYPLRKGKVPVPPEDQTAARFLQARRRGGYLLHQSRPPASQHPRRSARGSEDGRGIHRAGRTGARLSAPHA